MLPATTRRQLLRTSGVALLGGLAGCSVFEEEQTGMVNLDLLNRIEAKCAIRVTMHRQSGDERRRDAEVYFEEFTLNVGSTERREGVAEKRSLLVRYGPASYEGTDLRQVHEGHATFCPRTIQKTTI